MARKSGKWKINNINYKFDGYFEIEEPSNFFELRLTFTNFDDYNKAKALLKDEKINFINGFTYQEEAIFIYGFNDKFLFNSLGSCCAIIQPQFYITNFFSTDLKEINRNKFYFEIPKLTEWSKLSRFSQNIDDLSKGIVWDSKESAIFTINNAKLSIYPSSHSVIFDGYSEHYDLNQKTICSLEYDVSVPPLIAIKDIEYLCYLISFAYMNHIAYSSMYFCDENNKFSKYEIHRNGHSTTETNGNIKKILHENITVFSLENINKKLNFNNWLSHFEDIKILLDLVFASINSNQYLEVSFLLLTQCIDFIYTVIGNDDCCSSYKTKMNSMLEYYNQNKEPIKKIIELNDNDKRKGHCSLKEKLIDLFFDNNELPFIKDFYKINYISKATSKTRNYFTHHNKDEIDENYFLDPEEMVFLNRVLLCITVFYILKLLGYNTDEAKEIIDKKLSFYTYLARIDYTKKKG